MAAMRGCELVGFISGTHFRGRLHMNSFFVAQDYREKGIGTGLLLEAIYRACAEDMDTVVLDDLTPKSVRLLYGLIAKLEGSDALTVEVNLNDLDDSDAYLRMNGGSSLDVLRSKLEPLKRPRKSVQQS